MIPFRQVAALTGLAFALHLAVVSLSLVDDLRKISLTEGDVATYIVPGEQLLKSGHYSSRAAEPFLWESLRTPGLPLLIALSIALFGTPFAPLFLHPFSAALATFCAIDVTRRWGGSAAAQRAAGVMAAVLPNSLGLSAMLLTDALHAHLFLVWMWLLWRLFEDGDLRAGAMSAVVLAAMQLIRPTLALGWMLLAILGVLFFRKRRRIAWAAALIAASLVVPTYLSYRMFSDHGVYSVSFIGTKAARQYLQARALSLSTGGDALKIKEQITADDLKAAEAMRTARSAEAALHRVEREGFRRYASAHPLPVLKAYTMHFVQQLAAPHESVFVLFLAPVPTILRALGSALSLAMLGLASLGGVTLARRGSVAAVLFVLACALLIWGTGAFTAWQGGRLRLAADYATLPLTALGVEQALGWLHRMRA